MPFLSDARCRQKFGSAADVSVMVCAGETGEGKDTCQGDSGMIMIILNCLFKSVSLDFD